MTGRDFDSIYAGYSRMVYWAAYSVIKNPAAAMDLSQEVFLKAYRHMKQLSSMNDGQIKNWLYRVSVNAAVDVLRRNKREVLTDAPSDTALCSRSDQSESAYDDTERKEALRQAIDEMPDIYRQTVLLHYFSQLSYEEIASAMNVSVGTVKSRMLRAKNQLARILKGRGYDDKTDI